MAWVAGLGAAARGVERLLLGRLVALARGPAPPAGGSESTVRAIALPPRGKEVYVYGPYIPNVPQHSIRTCPAHGRISFRSACIRFLEFLYANI